MLSKRYMGDKKPNLPLNNLQITSKKKVEEKLANGKYLLEKTKCLICDSDNFELVSEKDRYGLDVSVVICKDCGLIQLSPRMDEKSYHKFYNDEYRPLYIGKEKPTDVFFEEQLTRGHKIISYIESIANISIKNMFILDIGAGAGGVLRAFQEKENKVLGIDIGNEYIEFGKEKGINLKTGSLKDLTELEEKPDIIIYAQVVEHLLDPVTEFKELKKILKPGTLVYIEVPGIKNLLNSYHLDFLKYIQNAHVYYFTLNSLTNCMKKAGFTLISGDEEIKSLFKLGEIQEEYKDDYSSAISFLQDLERKRSKLKFKLKNKLISSVDYLANKTGTYKLLKKFYAKTKEN
jgi:2-polyprenyl-3-methyl-5-hydroxy-6-metoxy-1,4-benzoquinol methylase